jgi:exonuclease VII large subunit
MSEDLPPRSDRSQGEDLPPGEPPRGAATDLTAELRELGQQLEAAFRAALESERARQLQRDLAGGVRELTHQVQAALRSLQRNPRLQQAEERGRQALSQAKESKLAHELQETVASGIAQLNEQLRKLVERLESERASGPGGAPAQQIHVEHEPPATGETTRLDDDRRTP